MLTDKEKSVLKTVSSSLGVKYDDLFNLIKFESGFNPMAKNPRSSARGLIQFTDSTAQSLGFKNSDDLIKKYPTVTAQLLKPVYVYLKQHAPFKDNQALYMSVFYPRYKNVSPYTVFPDSVRKANPGINRPIDYINKVESKTLRKLSPLLILFGIGVMVYLINKKSKGGNDGEKESADISPE